MKKNIIIILCAVFVLFNTNSIAAVKEVEEKFNFVGYKEDPKLKAYLEKEDNEKKLYQWRSLNKVIFKKSKRDGSCILTIEYNGRITSLGRTNRMNTGKKSLTECAGYFLTIVDRLNYISAKKAIWLGREINGNPVSYPRVKKGSLPTAIVGGITVVEVFVDHDFEFLILDAKGDVVEYFSAISDAKVWLKKQPPSISVTKDEVKKFEWQSETIEDFFPGLVVDLEYEKERKNMDREEK